MKIVDVQAIAVSIPQDRKFAGPSKGFDTESDGHVLVKVLTDEGIVGLGEAWRLTPRAVAAFIVEALKPRLLGADPTRIEALWRKMYQATFRYGRKGMVLNAISGVEIALWDILGKSCGLPVYKLLGGACWEGIRAYASLPPYENPADAAADAAELAGQGYHMVKLHQRDLESVRQTRRAVGEATQITLDVNGCWTPKEALAMARRLEEWDVRWLEEPINPMDDYDGLRFVRERCNLLVAAGENEYAHYGFKALIEKQAADLLQPDIIKSGGLLCCRKILAMAEAANLQVIPHSFYYGPGVAATAHFVMANPLSDEMEINATPLAHDFMVPALRPVAGRLAVSDKPGLGIELDEDVIAHHRLDR
ncbi:mandelate racemase/muconate lactonizing enzyme family protein [Solidesulfovibrio sp.]|uniref:mandelate racemase/muconate lactonizing enzyme family protein n=1 Tax=Solidesulfovibrio sp. TaxID=2910990 RepID=UPI002605AD07|nr:mandelate racemase/muconate lactonizing enzyme family protein [Solidesulfovibrio sp.]